MYGMVHTAARAMALDALGPAAWLALLQENDLSRDHFVSNQNYSDEVTFRIVSAISGRLGMDPDEMLRAFGEYWIEYAAKSPYGAMFRIGGRDLRAFLHNLNRMHSSVHATMQFSRMPSFEVIGETDNRIELLYMSDRTGLTEFVVGVLTGLLRYFGEQGHVSYEGSRPDGDVFTIGLMVATGAEEDTNACL